jgi:hypothetical protein
MPPFPLAKAGMFLTKSRTMSVDQTIQFVIPHLAGPSIEPPARSSIGTPIAFNMDCCHRNEPPNLSLSEGLGKRPATGVRSARRTGLSDRLDEVPIIVPSGKPPRTREQVGST